MWIVLDLPKFPVYFAFCIFHVICWSSFKNVKMIYRVYDLACITGFCNVNWSKVGLYWKRSFTLFIITVRSMVVSGLLAAVATRSGKEKALAAVKEEINQCNII